MKPSVFITGAGRGLGFCLVKLFLEKGYSVFAGQYRVTKNLDQIVGVPDLHRIDLDVTDDASVLAASRTVASRISGLDVLVNNAAKGEREDSTIDDLAFDTAAEIINVNALGPLRVTRAFLPLLCSGTMKTIINVSSEAGSIARCWRKGMFGYTMSKAALNMQTKLLHNYLATDGFHVLSIHPGWMKTDMGGRNADIEPEIAAQGIYRIISGQKRSKTPCFCDYNGKPLRY
ncbi:MAG: SDR family oxidoreductase [Chitinispirillaceae bacterium]|nr:SDR family oxidoreductase [Chitinispirillaceae bacterium]